MERKLLVNLATAYAVTLLGACAALYFAVASEFMRFPAQPPILVALILFVAAAIGLLMLFIAIGIGIFVWADARRRGMEPLLWTLVAVLVPYFIGFVIYLTQRQPLRLPCPACGAASSEREAFCPACGQRLRTACPGCQRPLVGEARFCPHCGTAIPAQMA